MKCLYCKNKIEYVSSLQKERNKNFFCNRLCYLNYVRRDKVPNADYFENIDKDSSAYWLGFIVADGNLHKDGPVLQINLHESDGRHLQKLADIFDKKVKYTSYYNQSKQSIYKGAYLSLSSHRIWSSLIDLGIHPNKTITDQSPVMDHIEDNLLPHFVRGLFDGDGCISFSKVKGKVIPIVSFSGEHRLIVRLKKMLIEKLELGDVKLDQRNNLTVLRWSGRRQCESLYNFMYCNNDTICLSRKKNKFEHLFKISKPKQKFFGVTKTASGKWNASIFYNGKRKHLGNYETDIEAARAHDLEAVKIGKPIYKINFIQDIS